MPLEPITREENFLSRAAGDGGKELEPITRTEHFLQRIIEAGGGGGGGAVSSVNGQTGAVVLDADDVGAEPTKFVATVTRTGSVFSCDKTFSELLAAYQSGKTIDLIYYQYHYFAFEIGSGEMLFVNPEPDMSGGCILNSFNVNDLDEWTNDYFGVQAKPAVNSITGTTATISPQNNTVYKCGTLTSLTIVDSPATGAYSIIFYSGATATDVTGIDNFTPEANKRYRIDVQDGYATFESWPYTPTP